MHKLYKKTKCKFKLNMSGVNFNIWEKYNRARHQKNTSKQKSEKVYKFYANISRKLVILRRKKYCAEKVHSYWR